ncbi:MAG: UDP-N-acetylmuramoyl-tripeptide--D-alanyl-D-alanine ligase [Anaerolineales bacterium]|nr:UDP-N-acetylmuramoyl-tripeptide--D-alanyl-D-alanine ligase [Chloroflexota bacterium]MBL6980565.1 UDP-N-acetylmuramoyl-tripeptide--D-alanyl-D-alanine ligase [Anaerolineales bacterium]
MLTLGDILFALIDQRPEWANQVITDAVVDSRQVIPGALFVAMPGEKVDGHSFVDKAFGHGASIAFVQKDLPEEISVLDLRGKSHLDRAIIPEIPFALRVDDTLLALQKVAHSWRRQLDIRVIGITGSVGKSTTKELVASVLDQRYSTLKNSGNLNNEIGLPLTMLRLSAGHRRAVLEMGLYVPGEIAFLCDLAQPQIGVITNVGTVHAERAGSQEAIARGKAELVEALPSDPEGVAILNYDDPLVRAMAEKTQARVFYYGLDSRADLWADQVEGLGLDGIRFRLHFHGETLHLRVPLIGRHSVHTVLRAAAVGLNDGLTWQEIINGLRSGHTQLRLVAVRSRSGALLLDDTYNASPQSSLAALNMLDEMEGHKIAVLGDMLELGQYEKAGHWKIGLRAAEVADAILTIGERSRHIAEAARSTGFSNQDLVEFENSDQAIEYLQDILHEDDVVLVKGSRGMRMDRIVATLEAR